jgi:hypothetical protein
MMVILKQKPQTGPMSRPLGLNGHSGLIDQVDEWIVATDMHDARRQAEDRGWTDLAAACYRMEFLPPPGKYSVSHGDYIVLVGSGR